MFYVGIDWSIKHDDICIIDNSGQKIKQFRIEVNREGFEKFLSELFSLSEHKENFEIGIETDKNIIVRFLESHKFSITALNPLSVHRFKERYNTAGQKDDKLDAFTIASVLKDDSHRFQPLQTTSASCHQLAKYSLVYEKIIIRRTRLINNLKSELNLFYPAFTRFFEDFSSNITLKVLQKIPSPNSLHNLTKEDFLKLVSDIKYFSTARKEKIFDFLSKETIFFEDLQVCGYITSIQNLIEEILLLNSKIKEVKKNMSQTFEQHEDAKLISSLPGAGEILAPVILSLMGDNREKFKSASNLQAFCGSAPITQQSGQMRKVKIRRGCNKRLRKAFYQMAFVSLRNCSWAKEVYDEQRSRGKGHSAALRVVSNKLVKITYAVWKNKIPYQERKFTLKRQKCMAV